MKHSEFLSSLLASAEILRVKNGLKFISAGLIVAAASNYCALKYSGKVTTRHPEQFEPERLRYAFSLFNDRGLTLAPYVLVKLRNKENGLDVPFSFKSSILVAFRRGKPLLSADIVFLEAAGQFLPHLLPSMQKNPLFKDGVNTLEVQKIIDKNILAYTKNLLTIMPSPPTGRLEEVERLAALPPKIQLNPSESLNDAFKKTISHELKDNVLNVTIPDFFDKDAPLELHITRANSLYIVHDCGSAIKYLSRCHRLSRQIVKEICEPSVLDGNNFIGAFRCNKTFLNYLRRVVMLAHSYLYHTQIERPIFRFTLDYDEYKTRRDDINESAIETIYDAFKFGYIENIGNIVRISTTSPFSETRWSFALEVRGMELTIRDMNRGAISGEILEALYYNHNVAGLDYEFIAPFMQRFGCILDNGEIVLRADCFSWRNALMRYFNMAVLVSEIPAIIKPF